MTPMEFLVHAVEIAVIGYSLVYAVSSLALMFFGFTPVRNEVRSLGIHDLDLIDSDSTCPSITVIVPAYNEEVTIVESVKALTRLDYPSLEIIVVNDGSEDATLPVMREAFRMRRRDIPIRAELECAGIRGLYEASSEIAPNVSRLVLVDKENGGHADALNAGLNLAVCPYFIAIDADSLLDASALKLVMRRIQEDPDILACGGQVGIANNCIVEDGTVTRRALPTQYLPLCQSVEYLRSYTVARTGFTRLDSLLILSGAFLVMQREAVLRIGGFLTGRVPYRLLDEYVGKGADTVCEDMEVVVRLHRYEREHGRSARVAHLPVPVCWTEVPSTYDMLSKQRRRWHKGLIEIMRYHRSMIFNPNYGRIGMFGLPYFVFFELCGPYVEALGYTLLPILALTGHLSPMRAAVVMATALGFGLLQSLVAVLCGTWLEPVTPEARQQRSMLNMDGWKNRLLLVAGCFLGEMGFRQMTVFWRIHGTWDYLRGHKGWDKFARAGFQGAKTAVAALALLAVSVTDAVAAPPPSSEELAIGVGAPSTPAVVEETGQQSSTNELSPEQLSPKESALAYRELLVLTGSEHREDWKTGWWIEATQWWRYKDGRSFWVGALRYDRQGGIDEGLIVGYGGRVAGRAGLSGEFRLSPNATAYPEIMVNTEAEMQIGYRIGGQLMGRLFEYPDVRVLDLAPGAIAYVRSSSWISVRWHLTTTWFDNGARNFQMGGMLHASAPLGPVRLRFLGGTAGEASLGRQQILATEIRSKILGAVFMFPRHSDRKWEMGVSKRWPEIGREDLYLHMGLRQKW